MSPPERHISAWSQAIFGVACIVAGLVLLVALGLKAY